LRIAQLTCANNIGVELFEFVNPPAGNKPGKLARKNGLLHLSIIDPAVNQLAETIEEHGGKIIARSSANPKRTIVFCQDPDGNILELASSAWDGF
jgi:predicted enzyme related to lactoylglutathione lyase